MADFEKSLDILMILEFSSKQNALEKNKTESGYTFMGIYHTAHPAWKGWEIVEEEVKKCKYDIKKASASLYDNKTLLVLVKEFYKVNFWDIARLDEVTEQRVADEIFIFGVNVGMKLAIKKTQEYLGLQDDGVVGTQTLAKLNSVDVEVFDVEFDTLVEQKHYEYIISKYPEKKIFANGWRNRSLAV